MYSLYVGFILLVLFVAFIWLCAAGNFGLIGKIVSSFFKPFKDNKKSEENINE